MTPSRPNLRSSGRRAAPAMLTGLAATLVLATAAQSNAGIARELDMSVGTVRIHLENIFTLEDV